MTSRQDNMIQFDNATRTYGSKIAVDRLQLSVESSELFALLGPNGAGKTTTIKMLIGLLRPDSGKISVCGHNVLDQFPQASRLLGYVPDQPFLYNKLTGREFLEFVADMRGLSRRESEHRIAEQVETFGLGSFLDDLAETYSHGMKQRVVLASALLHDPRVLVVDEPMVGLDPRSARLVKDLMQSLTGRGASVFMSTHTLAMAEEVADRIAILNNGRLHFLGTVEQLKDRMASAHGTLESLFLELTNPKNSEKETLPFNS